VLISADDSDAFTVDQIEYSTYKDDGVTVAKVISVDGSLTSVTIPSTVTYSSKTYDVKAVDLYNANLVSITLSDGIEAIGVREGYGLNGCSFLREVNIPDSVTTIGKEAFGGCVSLHTLYIPDSVTSIGERAFAGSGLVSVRLPEGSGFTSLSNSMFAGCEYLTSVAIPSNVTAIGQSCFSGCDRLQQVVIPENVASIGNHAFSDCSGLTFIDLRCDESTEFGYQSLMGHYTVPGAVKIRTSVPESVLRAADAINDTAQVGEDLEFGYTYSGNTVDGEKANHAWKLVDGYLTVWATKSSNTILDEANGNAFEVKDSEGNYKSVLDLIFYVEFVDDPSSGKYLLTEIYENSFWPSQIKTIVLPEGVTMVQNYGLFGAQLVKIPSSLTDFDAADNYFANSIQVFDAVEDGFTYPYLYAPCVIMSTGTSIVSGGYLENLSLSEDSVLFLDGSRAMISKINSEGLYPGCAGISDINGKVYCYDEDEGKWVQDTSLRTVEYNLNDGSGLKTRKIVKDVVGDGGIGFIPGKDFAGWFTAESGGDYVSPDTAIGTGYLTKLYAHWDGSQVLLGNGVTLTVDGTAYTGWATVPIDGTATVSFEGGFGLYCAPGFTVSGSTLTPVSGSHTFAVMAQPVECTTVTLDLNGGTGDFTSYSATVGSSAPSDFQAPARTGYDFAGYKNAQGTVVITPKGFYAESVSGYTDSSRLWINESSAVTLTAAWTAHTTAVTFNNMGVVADVTATATYGQDFPFVDSPTSSDARFDGYYDALVDGKAAGNLVIGNGNNYAEEGSQYFSDIYTWAGDISAYTLYAKWTPKYTLVNDATGGSYELSGDEPQEIPAPTKVGYTFAGWKLTGDADFTTAVYGPEGNVTTSIVEDTAFAADSDSIYVASLSSTVGGTVHLEPQWTAIKYKVYFDLDGGTGSFSTKTHAFGTKYTVAEPTKSGWIFLGWTVSGDAVSYAECSDTKNGTYVSMSTTTPSKNTTTSGSAIYVRNLSTDASKPTTLVANWAPGTYTIRYLANASDATGDMDIQTCYIGQEYNLTLHAFDRTGYSFIGWSTTSTGSVEYSDQQAVSDLAGADEVFDLYAVWQINQYTIHFANTGESSIPDIVQDYGTAVTAPANPTKAGYAFAGWSPAVPSVMPAQDTTCTAQWTVGTYEVTFNANGGKGTMAAQTIEYLTSCALSANTFTKTGYTFSSWNTAADGSGTSYADKAAVTDLGDITLYAQWTAIKYYVIFHDNTAADNTVRQTLTYAKSAALKANTFTNDPYDFLSWNTKADGTGTSYADKQTVKNLANTSGAKVNLYAQWDVPVTTITLDKGTGTADGTATAKYGSTSATIVTAPTGETNVAGYYDGDTLVINADGSYPSTASSYASGGTWTYTGETLTLTTMWKVPYEVGDQFVYNNILFEITSVAPNQVKAINVDEASDTIEIPEVAEYMDAKFSVVAIDADGFSGCETATLIHIPATVTAIGSGAFYGITFYEADGTTVLAKTAAALSGYNYYGSDSKLVREGISVGDQFTYGDLKYEVTSVEPYKVSVVGAADGVTIKNLDVPFVVTYKGISLDVTSIGRTAFYSCRTMVTASLGNVSEVDIKAFARCVNLKTVDTGESLATISAYAFFLCKNLENFDIGDSAKTLKNFGHSAFGSCESLASISIPSYVVFLGKAGEETFGDLQFADEDGNAIAMDYEHVNEVKGYKYVRNTDGVYVRQVGVSVGYTAIVGDLKYTVISSLPAEVEVSGFADGVTLSSLVVPESITFPDYAEYGEFVVTAIGEKAFYQCTALTSASLGHVDTIKTQAFYGCKNLVSVELPDVIKVGVKSFSYCTKLTDIEFGERLITLSAYAFYRCTSLTTLDLPDTLRVIGSCVFYQCTSLKEVDLGTSLKTIGGKVFTNSIVEKIVVPSTVVKISDNAFASCPSLKELVILSESVKLLHNLLENSPNVEMIVMPEAFGKLYQDTFSDYKFCDANGNVLTKLTKGALAGHVFVKDADGNMALHDTFTVTFVASPAGSASFAHEILDAGYGASIVVSDLNLYVDNVIVLLQPATGYTLTGWEAPESVDRDVTVRALLSAA
jgi:uncharacterized repeat protein (TIGR02543 family)